MLPKVNLCVFVGVIMGFFFPSLGVDSSISFHYPNVEVEVKCFCFRMKYTECSKCVKNYKHSNILLWKQHISSHIQNAEHLCSKSSRKKCFRFWKIEEVEDSVFI